ncbi:MAG: hypothetical protein J6T37_08340 [Bacteroidales bacterium]|nr:hypothetical protein [Bacteroidales bacterium]
MPKHSLTKKDEAYLTIEIDGKDYNIPLAKTLKVKEVRQLIKISKVEEMDQYDFMIEFLARYMGEEIVDEMTTGDVIEIFNLWKKANTDAEDLELGES